MKTRPLGLLAKREVFLFYSKKNLNMQYHSIFPFIVNRIKKVFRTLYDHSEFVCCLCYLLLTYYLNIHYSRQFYFSS